MKAETWESFCTERKKFQKITEKINNDLPLLGKWQQKLIDEREGPKYKAETPVVYNTALDEIKEECEIKLILVADNPGRREQAAENRRYLIGPSGKIAAGFFKKHPELEIDFFQNVLILNKTPVHTPRTLELRELCKTGGKEMENALVKSQKDMALLLISFHICFAAIPVWIIGYSEMKKNGIFETYTNCLKNEYDKYPELEEKLFFFRHFSMNQFTIDFNKKRKEGESCAECLKRTGSYYRKKILGS